MDIFRMPELVRHIEVNQTSAELDREWIVTNGLGGYASYYPDLKESSDMAGTMITQVTKLLDVLV